MLYPAQIRGGHTRRLHQRRNRNAREPRLHLATEVVHVGRPHVGPLPLASRPDEVLRPQGDALPTGLAHLGRPAGSPQLRDRSGASGHEPIEADEPCLGAARCRAGSSASPTGDPQMLRARRAVGAAARVPTRPSRLPARRLRTVSGVGFGCCDVSPLSEESRHVLRHPPHGSAPVRRGRRQLAGERRCDAAHTLPRLVEVGRGDGRSVRRVIRRTWLPPCFAGNFGQSHLLPRQRAAGPCMLALGEGPQRRRWNRAPVPTDRGYEGGRRSPDSLQRCHGQFARRAGPEG